MNYSIVIPVYLREESHRDVVRDSVRNIRIMSKNAYLIIVDDGSPLDTSFLKPYADMYVKHSENKGISEAWNTGKNKAPTEYVAIVNDDVKVPFKWLETLMEGFSDNTTGVTAPMQGGPHVKPQKMGTTLLTPNHKFYPGYCFMLKKSRFFEDFDTQFRTNCGDTDYWHRIKEKGLSCMRVGLSVYHKEGGVLHGMDYDAISKHSLDLFEKKWGFYPQEEYYS